MTRSGSAARLAGHWELAVLMALTGGAILSCYLAVVAVIYPLVDMVALPVYLGLAIAAAVAVSVATTSYQLASVRRNAHEITPDSDHHLHDTVASLSEQLGIAAPDLYLVEADHPNARAIGTRWRGAIVLNSGLYERLDDDELAAIVGHELSHLYYCDSLVTVASVHVEWLLRRLAAVVAMAVTLVVFVFAALVNTVTPRHPKTRRDRINRLVGRICVGAAGVVVLLPRSALSRYREFVADQTAAQLLDGPEPMVDALRALDAHTGETRDGSGPADGRLGVLYASHPSIERRIDVLEGDAREPTPTDPGPILGSGTRFGLTVAPVLVLAGYVGLLGDTVGFISVNAAPIVVLAGVGLCALGVVAFCWGMLFGAGGQTAYGVVGLCGTAGTVGAVLVGVPALVAVAATPVSAVAVAHLVAVGVA